MNNCNNLLFFILNNFQYLCKEEIEELKNFNYPDNVVIAESNISTTDGKQLINLFSIIKDKKIIYKDINPLIKFNFFPTPSKFYIFNDVPKETMDMIFDSLHINSFSNMKEKQAKLCLASSSFINSDEILLNVDYKKFDYDTFLIFLQDYNVISNTRYIIQDIIANEGLKLFYKMLLSFKYDVKNETLIKRSPVYGDALKVVKMLEYNPRRVYEFFKSY